MVPSLNRKTSAGMADKAAKAWKTGIVIFFSALMSEEQLNAFLEKVKADISLQEKLKAAADDDAVLAIAKEAGFGISADDLTKAESELSEDDLESVAAGGKWSHPKGSSWCGWWCQNSG